MSGLQVTTPDDGGRMDGVVFHSSTPTSSTNPPTQVDMTDTMAQLNNNALSFKRKRKRGQANDVTTNRPAKQPRQSKYPNPHIRPRRDNDPDDASEIYEPSETDIEVRGTNGQIIKKPSRLQKWRMVYVQQTPSPF